MTQTKQSFKVLYKNKFLAFIIITFTFNLIQTFGQNKTKVLIVGTFHMAGTPDPIKVENDDILGAKRQTEIKDILTQLAKFKPTKIFVENIPENEIYWDSIYTDLKKGVLPKEDYLIKSEIFQLGLQLAQKLNLEKGCVCVDWQHPDSTKTDPLDKILYKFNSDTYKYYQSIPNKNPSDFQSEDYNTLLEEQIEFNKAVPSLNLKDVLLKFNSKDIQRKLFYANLFSGVDKNAYKSGAISSINGILRNVNIFMNIVQKTEKDDKNIIIIYGAGHGEALRVMLQSHPRFEVVELDTILK